MGLSHITSVGLIYNESEVYWKDVLLLTPSEEASREIYASNYVKYLMARYKLAPPEPIC